MPGPDRNTSVDLIRLLALIGICIVNIVFLGLPVDVALAPAANSADRVAAFLVEALLQSKFFLLFSFLFGWGIHVQQKSAHSAEASFAGRYGRRLIGLAVLGCLHAVFVFTGDILFIYALLGLTIWPLHMRSPRTLIRVAYCMVPLAAVFLLVLALMLPQEFAPIDGPGLGGSYFQATKARLADWPETLAFLLLFQGPLAFGAFAMGLAAGKTDFFAADSSGRAALRRLVPWFVLAGIPLNLAYAASMGGLLPAEQEVLQLVGFVCVAIGGPMLAAVYLHLMLMLNDFVRLPPLLVAAGQNSLSVYVLQGVFAGYVFGGYGLGLFGRLGFAGLVPVGLLTSVLTVLAVGAVTKSGRRGPLEVLLRAVTYR